MADSLPELDQFNRDTLRDSQARLFRDFRLTLTPRYARAWMDIAAGYVALLLIFWGSITLDRLLPQAWPANVAIASLAIGYIVAFIQLFFHEAAHYLLASSHAMNDRLANVFIGWFLGQDIRAYRAVHLDHHRYLGNQRDTERSYFDPLNARFFLEALTGIKVVRVLLLRSRVLETKAKTKDDILLERRGRLRLVMGAVLNLVLVGLLAWGRHWSLMFAWVIGMLVVQPAVNALRQLLEHRSFKAKSGVDYSKEPHGAVTRLFESGPIGSTLGAAGFNRHLLHHWEPQISCTRLGELEAFLLDTEAAEVVRSTKISYARALMRLMRAP